MCESNLKIVLFTEKRCACRSKDYQSLIWVFTQFFKKVHSTKPAASRNESAEIFVVCLGYKAPDKIDPRFLDARHVFSEVDDDGRDAAAGLADDADGAELVNPERRRRKPAAVGYESGATHLFKSIAASEFVGGDKSIHVLNSYHRIDIDQDRIRNHPRTTPEVVECCRDIKVLGMKELRLLKKWREALRKDFAKEEKASSDKATVEEPEEAGEKDEDAEEDEELRQMDEQVAAMREEEKRAAKRVRKKAAK
jgi:AdoMet-dependent rRNA methyltransferase SPB1